MRVMVLGATGGSGGRIVNRLLAEGVTPRAAVRGAGPHRALRAAGADPVRFDLLSSPAELAAALDGTEVVLNAAAAAGVQEAPAVDRDGVIAAIDAAQKVGVRRWIQVSMAGVDDPDRLPGLLRSVAAAKRVADDHLTGSALAWTILRPPWLTDEAATGRIAFRVTEQSRLSRTDLAAVAVSAIDRPATHGRILEICNGSTPVERALAGLAAATGPTESAR
ncbi:NAD(P)H-binding protein [Kitasatospora sp. SUK 42]|uniref:NAD(P)H-binding protein n=1 Tax=Kitasatospora sp. SUK 42 TaxID=1588882 RepID=UPI0018C914C4|nr:NAD(P)H-binding protein [Kitasatospora sp. SUK 42]MBV2154794.1 NAD(P)H-binding protein [Kitasatospora sp. SUK 42]